MSFKKAKIITNEIFEKLSPINVFHKEMEESAYVPEDKYKNKHILFRNKFNVENSEKTILRISADDYYKVYINGEFITQGPAPAYNFAYNYNEIDVTNFVNLGENSIAVHTYYQGLINRVWVSGDLRHMLVCEIESNGQIITATDETWKTHIHTAFETEKTYGYETGFIEIYNANSQEIGFEKTDFDDSYWDTAKIKQNCYYKFVKQSIKQLDIYSIKPQIIEKNNDGYFIDVGQELIAYLSFNATGNKNDVINIKSGEELNDDGSVRYKLRCNCIFDEKFILSDKTEKYVQYDYKAFRYLQLDVPENVTIDNIEIIIRHYPCDKFIPCPVADENVQKIWDLCANTIKFGTQEILMDCPTREKGQYLGDATISAIVTTILNDDTTFMKKILWDFANTSFIATSLMSVANSSLMQEIADYSLQFPLQVLWLYNYDHDIEFLREMQPFVKNVMDDFTYYEREDGLVENVTDKWNLVDWPANLRDNYDFDLTKPIGPGVHNVINAFYYGANVAYEKINEILGIDGSNKSENIKNSFNDMFYNNDNNLYVDSENSDHTSIHSNVLPLLFNMNENDNEKIIELIKEKGIKTCGVYMAMFMLLALRNAGETELMMEQILSEHSWNKMLSQGATTTFEAWGKEDKWNTSLFHPWATAPIIALTDTKFPF